MGSLAFNRKIQALLLATLFLTGIVVTPWMSFDPVNLPKYQVLVPLSFTILGLIAADRKSRMISLRHLFPSILFLTAIVLVLLQNSNEPNQLYGSFGRNFGFLTCLALLIVAISASRVYESKFNMRVLGVTISVSAINIVYGFFQWQKMDFLSWSYQHSPIFGTLGNPNFFSAYLGISSAIAFGVILDGRTPTKFRALLFLQIASSLFVLVPANSVQGLYIFMALVAMVGVFRLSLTLGGAIQKAFLFFTSFSVIAVIAVGTMGRGVLGKFLLDGSVSYRGDYWRAGIKMGLDELTFGKGFDSFGSWYRYFRDEKAVSRRGPDVVADSAHNLLIDLFANGGVLLVLTYVILVFQVLYHAIRILRRMRAFNGWEFGPILGFLGFQIQSLISVNHMSISVLGWLFGGMIVGQSLKSDFTESQRKEHVSLNKRTQLPAKGVLAGVASMLLGISVSVAPFRQDVAFYQALVKSEKSLLISASIMYPRNSQYLSYASKILLANNFNLEASTLARKSLQSNPRDFYAWESLLKNPLVRGNDLERVRLNMQLLDPKNNSISQN